MDVDSIVQFVLDHFPFFTALVVFMLVGQVMTKNVFTKTAHYTRRPVWLWWWGRKTLALHPVVAGAVLGIVWRTPEPGMEALVVSMGYFAMAGALSVWSYELLKGVAKKYHMNLDIPGVSNPPGK